MMWPFNFKQRRILKSLDAEIMISGHEACQQIAMSREEFKRHQSEIKRLQELVYKLGGPFRERPVREPSAFDENYKPAAPMWTDRQYKAKLARISALIEANPETGSAAEIELDRLASTIERYEEVFCKMSDSEIKEGFVHIKGGKRLTEDETAAFVESRKSPGKDGGAS